MLGVTDRTYRNWIQKGLETKKGIHWDLVCKIEEAEAERDKAYLEVINRAALIGQETITETVETYPDGEIKEKRVIKREGPDVATVKWLLERSNPSRWAERKYIDMETRLRAEGFDETEIAKSNAELSAAIAEAVEDESE